MGFPEVSLRALGVRGVGDGRVEANYGFTIFGLKINVSFHKVTLPKDTFTLLLTFVGLMWVLLFRLVPRHLPC